MPTCAIPSGACSSLDSETKILTPKTEKIRRPVDLAPVPRPHAPREVGASEARTPGTTARVRANPRLTYSRMAPIGAESGVGVLDWKVCDETRKKEGLHAREKARTFSGRSSAVSWTIDLCSTSGSLDVKMVPPSAPF